MKKCLISLLVIAIVALLIITGNLYYDMQQKDIVAVEQNEKIQQLENEISELENKFEQKYVAKNEENKKEDIELEEIPIGKVSKDKFKVANTEKKVDYYKDEKIDYDNLGITVEISDEKAYITIDSTNETLQSFPDNIDLDNIKSVKDKEIKGFLAKPVEVFYGQFSQEVINEVIFFLMDDGTVEYIKVADMLNNASYSSQGKIEKLSNIKKFDILSIWEEDGGGIVTTIAIDEDGYYYDLNELL